MTDKCGHQWLGDIGVMTCIMDPHDDQEHYGSDSYPPVGDFLEDYKELVKAMTNDQLLEYWSYTQDHEEVQEEILLTEIKHRMEHGHR